MKKVILIDDRLLAAAFITTGDPGTGDPGAGNPGSGDPGTGDPGSGDPGSGDDLSTLFSPEEIEAKKTTLAEQKAEEDRRAALTEEQRAAEDAAAAEAAKGNEIPETYEFTPPEGMTIDEELLGDVQAFAKENKLTAAAAKNIADLGIKLVNKQNEIRENQFNEVKTGWLKTAQGDPEIGADVLKGKDSVAAKAFNTIATPEMKDLVDQFGIGNHPEFLRMFYRLSTLMGDDKMHMPGLGNGTPQGSTLKETVGGIFNHPSRQDT